MIKEINFDEVLVCFNQLDDEDKQLILAGKHDTLSDSPNTVKRYGYYVDNKIVAYIQLDSWYDYLYIDIAVLKEYRGERYNIGGKLIQEADLYLKRNKSKYKGLCYLVYKRNIRSRKFIEKHGFSIDNENKGY